MTHPAFIVEQAERLTNTQADAFRLTLRAAYLLAPENSAIRTLLDLYVAADDVERGGDDPDTKYDSLADLAMKVEDAGVALCMEVHKRADAQWEDAA